MPFVGEYDIPSISRGPSVSLDARFIGYAGIGRMVNGLWSGLIEAGANVIGLWPRGAPRDWMGTHRSPPPGPCVTVSARPFLPAEQIALPSVLRRLGVAVHHAPFFSVPYLSRTPIVLTVHDLFPYLHPSDARSPATAFAYRALIPAAIRRARIIVAVSPFTAQQLASTFDIGGGQLKVIEHGVDHLRWHPKPREAVDEVKQRFRLPERYVLYVGTLKRHKNLATLLRALRSDHPALVLAGATEPEFDAAALPAAKVDILALGRVSDEDLAALYAGARALLLPSLYEAVGFTALEAMACGVPVVCSNGGGLPDTVGDAGLVVPVTDVGAWGEAITHVDEDDGLRRRMVDRGLERTRTRSWRSSADQYLETYREALA